MGRGGGTQGDDPFVVPERTAHLHCARPKGRVRLL